jgi:hypothetical protein
VTKKNWVFWDIRSSSASQKTSYISATEPRRLMYVRFEVFTTVSMKNADFWDIEIQNVPHRIYTSLQMSAG